MRPNHQTDQFIVNTASRIPPYTVLTFAGKNYRVLTREHNGFLEMSKIWSVFWFLFASFMLGSALILLFEQNISFILTISEGCVCIFTGFTFYKRNKISHSILYSSINLMIWLIPVIVLSFLQIKQLLIPFCFYSNLIVKLVLIEMLISIKFMTNKSQMLGKMLIVMETLMIVLKVDDKIQTSWKDIFFIHVVFFLFLSICVIFMTGYLVYLKFKQNEENLMKQKFPGALLIYFNTIAFCLLTGIPLFNVYLDIEFWILCFSLSGLFASLGAYVYLYRKDIVVFFCTLNEIKAFDQIISFEPIEGINNSKSEVFNNAEKKTSEPIYLYRVSENWLSKDPLKGHDHQEEENPEEENEEAEENNTKMTDCTICLDNPAEVVWMPCGHLTVCMECCSFMFDKKNFNCVLCKKTPEQIFMIETQQKNKTEKIINENSLSMSIEKDDVTMISGNIVVGSENHLTKKSKRPKNNKQEKMEKYLPVKNKYAFLVKEGYNIKII